jgi:homoserine O-succinyltransferase
LPAPTDFRFRPSPAGERDPIVVGLVNNMPDAALRSTERQYRELLDAASGGRRPVLLRLFSLPDLQRGEDGRAYVSRNYDDLDALAAGDIDGLIVTGTEPRTSNLIDEPYWPSLTRLIDWAQEHTISAIWSCLAAHAAVLHIDGIDRHSLGEKLLGVFDCQRTADHALVRGTPQRWQIPHSRHNALSEQALAACGYDIVSRSAAAGVDMFIKQRHNLFVFFQGHPEYDVGALAREYRRDVGRFVSGRASAYPAMPRNYFDEAASRISTLLQPPKVKDRCDDIMAAVAALAPKAELRDAWNPLAVRIYANWLAYLAQHKTQPVPVKPAVAALEAVPG